MSGNEKISPNNTYVIDEALLDEMDSIELTGLLNELSEHLADDGDSESMQADEQVDADSGDVGSGDDDFDDDNEPLTLELEVDDIEMP